MRLRRGLWLTLVAAVLGLTLNPAPARGADELATFTIAVVPDTQIYVQSDAGAQVFQAQYDWIVAEQQARNIVFVTHEGDVSQNPSSVTEWDRIEDIFAILDQADIPYGISPGNHDINPDGSAPELDQRFSAERYADSEWFAGRHQAEGNRSNYQLISVDGHELLFLHVRHLQPAYGDVAALLAWVDGVLATHPDHLVFLTTHEFTDGDGTVRFPALQTLVEQHCNVAAIFSGHRTAGAARGAFDDACDRTVQHVLTNYQQLAGGGQGFLRTVEIDPLTLQAAFQVYSPTLDENRTGAAESFSAALAPLVPIAGDVTCDRQIDIGDALAIAQFSVGIRTAHSSCPLVDPTTQLNAQVADVTGDNLIDVGDALMVARCTVGLASDFCPD